jgi:glycosyltransferase involved in cell wall biosynthesis
LDILVDAFIELHSRDVPDQAKPTLKIAGWLGKQHEAYWQEQQDKLREAGLESEWEYCGAVDRDGKLAFLDSVDLICVPTPYQEPKGLFLLEGLAAGVPYLQPAHGAFPEVHARLGGGQLFPPESATVLADHLEGLCSDRQALSDLGRAGREALFKQATTEHEAEALIRILETLVDVSE